MKSSIFSVLRIVIAAIFLYSGFSKLMEPYQNFLAVLYSYKVISGGFAVFAAHAIPWAEFIGGVFLLAGLWTRRAAAGLWVLNSIFIVGLAQALMRKLPLTDCGCFGGSGWTFSPDKMLVIDIVFWLVFASFFFNSRHIYRWSLDRRE